MALNVNIYANSICTNKDASNQYASMLPMSFDLHSSSATTSYTRTAIKYGSYTLTLPSKSGTLATTADIPSTSNFVTLASAQTISGAKTFSGAVSFTGASSSNLLNLANCTYGIKWSSANYTITNMECGTVSVTVNKTTNSETSTSVTFHNGSKGAGSWHVFLVAADATSGSGWGSSVLCAPSSISTTGFSISSRRVYGADVSYNSTSFTVHWFAIKGW